MKKNKYAFSKKEKVKSKKEISRIFSDGIFFYSDILSIGFVKNENKEQQVHKVAISVPKKNVKSAVDRNRIKRMIRESYRLNKEIIYDVNCKNDCFLNIIFIYKNKEILEIQKIQKKVINLLKKLCS